ALRKTGATGLEPATSGVTGRRSNQLNYAPRARPSVASASQPYPALARVIAGQKLDGITGRALGDLGQAQLPQERHAVRVDVLAGDEAVLDRDHVHAPVLDLAAGRLDLDSRPGHLALLRAAGRPLLDDEVIADVRAAPFEREVGKDGEDAADRAADRFLADVDVAGRVVLEDRVVGVHREDRVDVVRVPCRVVAIDEVLKLGAVHPVSLVGRDRPRLASPRNRRAGRTRRRV